MYIVFIKNSVDTALVPMVISQNDFMNHFLKIYQNCSNSVNVIKPALYVHIVGTILVVLQAKDTPALPHLPPHLLAKLQKLVNSPVATTLAGHVTDAYQSSGGHHTFRPS